MTKNLPEKQDREENRTKHEEKTGLTALWQDVVGTDQKPSASERGDYYIQTGAVWLAFKKLVEEDEELSRYRGNIAFNMSSGAGWDIKQGDIPFYYPPGEDNIHPFDFYVPVDHVIDRLEKADRFSLNIEKMLGQPKAEQLRRFEESRGIIDKVAYFMLKPLFRLIDRKEGEKSESKKLIKPMTYEEKYIELGKLMVQALRENKDLIKHKSELDTSSWKRYNPASGKPSPFYLSANEMGATFDFTMRKEKPKTPTRKLKR